MPFILLVGFALLILVIFIVRRNRKDQKDLEHRLNEDYKKTHSDENDPDASI